MSKLDPKDILVDREKFDAVLKRFAVLKPKPLKPKEAKKPKD